MKTLDQMSTDIREAEGVRSRHDGVHEVHSYLGVLRICHDIKEADQWLPAKLERMFEDAMVSVRIVNCTGFAPKRAEGRSGESGGIGERSAAAW